MPLVSMKHRSRFGPGLIADPPDLDLQLSITSSECVAEAD